MSPSMSTYFGYSNGPLLYLITGYPTRSARKKPDPTRLIRGLGSSQIFLTQQKKGCAWAEFFDPKPDPTRILYTKNQVWPDPTWILYTKNQVWPDPTRPCDGSGSGQKIEPDGRVGPGTGWRKKCRVFFDPIRPDKWSGLPFLPLIPDVF